MEFLVKLISVEETDGQDARDCLYGNCTHVAKDYWLFEGDVEALHEGINLKVVGEDAIEGTGDLTGTEIKQLVRDVYGIDDF